MPIRPNLNFAGFAREVLAHYQDALGGEVSITPFKGSAAEQFVPADWGDNVLYGTLRGDIGELDVMDAPPGRESQIGGNVAIAIELTDETRAAAIFAKLAAGGNVMMPFERTFFAKKFGMAADKFGVRWMVTVDQQPS